MASAAIARTDLEALLRARKLDRTVTSSAPAAIAEAIPTGLASLDARLGGGLPRGELSEITGPRSSGRGSVAQSALAALTRQDGLAALIDPLDMFDPPSAADAGLIVERLLWIRGEALSGGRWDVLLDRGLKALNLVLQAGGFDLAVFDVAEVPHEAIRRLPFTTWFRLQRAIEGSRTACLLIGRAPVARSAGGVSLQLTRRNQDSGARTQGAAGTLWAGSRRACPAEAPTAGASEAGQLFAGLDIEARIIRAREPEAGVCRVRLACLAAARV